MYQSAGINCQSFRLFIRSTSVMPCDFNSSAMSFTSMFASSFASPPIPWIALWSAKSTYQLMVYDCHLLLRLYTKNLGHMSSFVEVGVGVEHGGDLSLCPVMLFHFGGVKQSVTKTNFIWHVFENQFR